MNLFLVNYVSFLQLMLRVFLFGNILLVRPKLASLLCYVESLVHVYVVRTGFGILWHVDRHNYRGDSGKLF